MSGENIGVRRIDAENAGAEWSDTENIGVEQKNAESDGVGRTEARLAGSKVLATPGVSEGFLEFEGEHPDLAGEMRLLEIPQNERDFTEQGYSFYLTGPDGYHIRRETEEFRNWKENRPGEEPPREMRKYAPIDFEGIREQEGYEKEAAERGEIVPTSSSVGHERELLEARPAVAERIFQDELSNLEEDLLLNGAGQWGLRAAFDENGKLVRDASREAQKEFVRAVIRGGGEEVFGEAYLWWRKDDNSLDVDTERAQKVLENYGINPDEPEIRQLAVEGLANTIDAASYEKSDQADWYFETFFGKNPEEFKEAIKAEAEKRGEWFNEKLNGFMMKRGLLEASEEPETHARDNYARLGAMREVSRDYVDAYVETLRDDAWLDEDYFAEKSKSGMDSGGEVTGKRGADLSEKYGKMKIVKLGDWGDYIQENVDPEAKYYIESVGVGDERRRGEYLAVQFTVGERTYCIAESVRDGDAMYLAWGDKGEDLREYFRASSKAEAKGNEHVMAINHLDKQNFGDSLDKSYAKAFFLLFGGKKSDKGFGREQVFPVGDAWGSLGN